MKIFVSWSGEESKQVAEALRDWVQKVLQGVEPWMSSRDIATGVLWSTSIASNLRDCKVGIICVTHENVAAPWLHFEAGAISKDVADTYVCPLLFGIEPSALVGAMGLFQAQRFSKEGVLKILQTIRNHPDQHVKMTDIHFIDTFDKWWPDLERTISTAQLRRRETSSSRTASDMTSEILEIVRAVLHNTKQGSRSDVRSKTEDIRASFGSPIESVHAATQAVRSASPADVIQKLIRWDPSLVPLLNGEQSLRNVVDAILGNHMGEATAKVMAVTSYDLPKARTFVDSLLIAISRLAGTSA